MRLVTQLLVVAAVASFAVAYELGFEQGEGTGQRTSGASKSAVASDAKSGAAASAASSAARSAAERTRDEERALQSVALDVVFLVDQSGSVGDANIAVLDAEVKEIVHRLSLGTGPTESRLACTTFSTELGNKPTFATFVGRCYSFPTPTKSVGWGTGTGAALYSAYTALKTAPTVPGRTPTKVVMLLTDGAPNTLHGCEARGLIPGERPSKTTSKNFLALKCARKALGLLRTLGVRFVYVNLADPTKPPSSSHSPSTRSMFGGKESAYLRTSYAELHLNIDSLVALLSPDARP